jgi:hypothetical protein
MTLIKMSMNRTRAFKNEDQIAATHLGMAHFAGTGPEGMQCVHCLHWNWGMKRSIGDSFSRHSPREAPCSKYYRLTPKNKLPKQQPFVPGSAAACRHFSEWGANAKRS